MGSEKPSKYDLRQRRLNTILQRIFYQCWQNALKECNDNDIAFSRAVSETAALYRNNTKEQCAIAICYHRLTVFHREFQNAEGKEKYRLAVNIIRYARLITNYKPSVSAAIRDYTQDIEKYLVGEYPEYKIR